MASLKSEVSASISESELIPSKMSLLGLKSSTKISYFCFLEIELNGLGDLVGVLSISVE
jgi:hypothetical protein